jgi:hypothetical protein
MMMVGELDWICEIVSGRIKQLNSNKANINVQCSAGRSYRLLLSMYYVLIIVSRQ